MHDTRAAPVLPCRLGERITFHTVRKPERSCQFNRRAYHCGACSTCGNPRMAYFRNNTVNLLNLHYGIHSLALSGSGAFFAVFLLQSGVSAPAVLASFAAILLGRLAIRPSVLVLATRFGLKPLVIAGTIGTGLQYPLLAEVHGVGPTLLLLCAVSSVA